MAQAQDVAANTVSGLQPLSYLNTNQPSTVLRVEFARSPKTTDRRFKIGTIWLDTKDLKVFALIKVQNNAAFWSLLGQGTGDLESLTGNTGDKVFPAADGNIAINGSGVISVDGNSPINELIISASDIVRRITGNSGGPVGPTVADNINIVGTGGVNVVGNPGTNTLTISSLAGGGFPITEFVVGPIGKAGFQTIQAAIDAASTAGKGTVYIQPDTYTEDLTLKDKVELVGAIGSGQTGSVTIDGTHTPPTSGNIAIRNVLLKDATAIFSSVAAGTTEIVLKDISIEMTNGFTFDLLNWTGPLIAFNVSTPSGTSDGFIKNTGGSLVLINNSEVGLNGQTMRLSGPTLIFSSVIACEVFFETGSNPIILGTDFQRPLSLNNNSVGSLTNCSIFSGSDTAITMDSTADWGITNTVITSTNAITIGGNGTGTLTIENLSFTEAAGIDSGLTIARGTTLNGLESAITFNTSDPAARLNISQVIIQVEGTDVNIPLTLKAKGTGPVIVENSNLAIQTLGKGLEVKEGANARMGVATLAGGTVTVANTSITATTRIFLTSQGGGAGATDLRISARTVGVDFTISAGDLGDTDIIAWMLVEPA